MRYAVDMPELQGDVSAPGMHGFRDLAPSFDLRRGVDARRVLASLPLLGNLRGF